MPRLPLKSMSMSAVQVGYFVTDYMEVGVIFTVAEDSWDEKLMRLPAEYYPTIQQFAGRL